MAASELLVQTNLAGGICPIKEPTAIGVDRPHGVVQPSLDESSSNTGRLDVVRMTEPS